MRKVYRILGYVIAAEVVIQAMAIVYGVAGLGKWVENGGVFDKAVLESQSSPFSEAVGFAIHGINGMMIIPVLALLLFISSFFAKVPGAVKWGGIVLLLVAIQATLGLSADAVPALGALHGLNALALFSAAFYTGHRVATGTAGSPAVEGSASSAAAVSD
jgi:Family of unknown function (DUF6220)